MKRYGSDRSAEEILGDLIELLEGYLSELDGVEGVFCLGEKRAYAEVLEVIRTWDKARSFGLDYDIGKRFRI